jgi:hypothetical protein
LIPLGGRGGLAVSLHTQLVIMLKHCLFFLIKNEYYSVQARLLFLFSMEQRPIFFPNLGGQIIYFIYKNCQTPPPPKRNQMVVPKINQVMKWLVNLEKKVAFAT